MARTVETVIRTSHGIVVVRSRTPKENQWRLPKIEIPKGSVWTELNSLYINEATGLVVRKFKVESEDTETILCSATVSDTDFMTNVVARGKDGNQVYEVSYYDATHGFSVQKPIRVLLQKHKLNRAPEAGT